MAVTLYLKNANASDPSTARQLTEASGSGNNNLTSDFLNGSSTFTPIFTGWVTDGYGNRKIAAGTWTIIVRSRLNDGWDTTSAETFLRVKIYKREGTTNNLLGTSSSQEVNGTTYSNRSFTINLSQVDLASDDDIFLELEAHDSNYGDSKLDVNVENSSNQSRIEHPDLIIETEQEGFRFRDDNGSESSATWLENQDTNVVRAKNLATRLRMILNVKRGDPPSSSIRLEYADKNQTEEKDVLNYIGTTGIGFGDSGSGRRYLAQGFVPTVDLITHISFYLVGKDGSSDIGYLVWIDNADSNSNPQGSAHVGIGGVTEITNAQLTTGALTKYALATPVRVTPGNRYCICFAPWNTSTHALAVSYQDVRSSIANPYANGRRVHLDDNFANPTAPDSGNADILFEIWGHLLVWIPV